jgi:hypothetical protein
LHLADVPQNSHTDATSFPSLRQYTFLSSYCHLLIYSVYSYKVRILVQLYFFAYLLPYSRSHGQFPICYSLDELVSTKFIHPEKHFNIIIRSTSHLFCQKYLGYDLKLKVIEYRQVLSSSHRRSHRLVHAHKVRILV